MPSEPCRPAFGPGGLGDVSVGMKKEHRAWESPPNVDGFPDVDSQHFADVNAGNSNTQATFPVDNCNQRSCGLVVVGRVNTDRFVSADLDSDLTLIRC